MRLSETNSNGSKAMAEMSEWLSRPTQKSGIRTLSRFGSALGTSQGSVRHENQDRAVVASYVGGGAEQSFDLYAVCDGLGGMREGGQCASLALSAFVLDLIRTRALVNRMARLRRAVEASNRAVYHLFREGGGTTIAAVLIDSQGATLVAVGDSRIYVVGSEGNLVQLTTDDTIAARVAEFQGVNLAEFAASPFSHQLAQFIGQRAQITPQVRDLESVQKLQSAASPKAGAILLTTDGIHAMPSTVLEAVVRAADTAKDVVSRLISISDWIGGHDNATILCMTPRSRTQAGVEGRVPGTLVLEDSFSELRMAVAYSEDFDVTDNIYKEVSPIQPPMPYPGIQERAPQQGFDFRDQAPLIPRVLRRDRHRKPRLDVPGRGKVGKKGRSAEAKQLPTASASATKTSKPSSSLGPRGRKAARSDKALRPAKVLSRQGRQGKKSRVKKSGVQQRPQIRIDILDEE